MTWDRVGWVRPAGPGGALGSDGVEARLGHADDDAASALRALVGADDVAWSTPASAAYRAVLAEGVDGVRAARRRLDAALDAAARHDAAVEAAREAAEREIAAQALAWLLGGAG